MQNNNFSIKDSILEGIDFEELITTIQSNESEITDRTIIKVYDEILQAKLEDARHILKENIEYIKGGC